jgi:hypothetical protein
MSASLSEAEVIEMAYKWFGMLNNHAPLAEFLPFLNLDGLEMKFPESTLRTQEDFTNWHHAVTHKFFDQSHEVKQFNVHVDGDQATVKVIVNWRARTWNSPDATSQYICGDAHQTWKVKKDPSSGKVLICYYSVDSFQPF